LAPDLSPARSSHGTGRVGDHIFVIGGEVRGLFTDSVEMTLENGKEMPPMKFKRYKPGVGVVDDNIFCVWRVGWWQVFE
jgi:hypothetical protein